MLRVISVSLGAPSGDFQHQLKLKGKVISLERIGTNGKVPEALELLRCLDGKVDVLCLGGVNRYYYAGKRAFPLPLGQKLAAAVKITPLVDGSWVKQVLEPLLIENLVAEGQLAIQGKAILLVSALDRPAMARVLARLGGKLVVGDAMFGLGLPLAFRSLAVFNYVALVTLPFLRLLPLALLYPLGEKQNRIVPRFANQYDQAELIAGDFHFIYRHLPANLAGKVILTSTVRPEDIAQLRQRKLSKLITLTPQLNGRSLGANLWEGVLRALVGEELATLAPEPIKLLIDEVGLQPHILQLDC